MADPDNLSALSKIFQQSNEDIRRRTLQETERIFAPELDCSLRPSRLFQKSNDEIVRSTLEESRRVFGELPRGWQEVFKANNKSAQTRYISRDDKKKTFSNSPTGTNARIRIGSWNLSQHQKDDAIKQKAKSIVDSGCHVFALQEVIFKNLPLIMSELKRIDESHDWKSTVSEEKVGKNWEYLAFIYRSPFRFKSARLANDDNLLWIRRPYYAKFHLYDKTFVFCTAHIRASEAMIEVRRMRDFVTSLYKKNRLRDAIVIVLGDFNLCPSKDDWKHFQAAGWRHTIPSDKPTNLLGDQVRILSSQKYLLKIFIAPFVLILMYFSLHSGIRQHLAS